MSNDDRVQHFFAYFQQEAVALYHQKILSRSDASAIASAFARIAADVERHVPEVDASFMQAALRFAKAHIESDRLDRHDDVEQVEAEVYDKADAEYNESKVAMVRAYQAHSSPRGTCGSAAKEPE